ncbi:MAG: winged helix-turn-helix transcriptional regulator [Candidatus Nitrosocosmicus sp.]|nr:winged helix-turn-helix transcriptional regulator [Candidatus Nitrosocosmicus sp.]
MSLCRYHSFAIKSYSFKKGYYKILLIVEYRLTPKGQELVESIINLLQWIRKWSSK